MKTITWQAGTPYTSTNTTELTIPKPSDLINGDWLWLFCSNQNVTSMNSPPTGFTNTWNASQTALATSIFTKWITDAGSEPADYTVAKASARGLGVAVRFRNVDPTTPNDVTRTGTTNGTGGPGFSAITPVTVGALLVAAYATYKTAGNEPDSLTTNGDQGKLVEVHTDDVTINLMNVLLGEVVGSGQENVAFTFTETHTGTNTRTNSTTFALRPAPDDPVAGSGKFFQFL